MQPSDCWVTALGDAFVVSIREAKFIEVALAFFSITGTMTGKEGETDSTVCWILLFSSEGADRPAEEFGDSTAGEAAVTGP